MFLLDSIALSEQPASVGCLNFIQARPPAYASSSDIVINLTKKDNALVFTVKVVPRASKSEIVGELDGALRVRIASPPVDGAANAELVKLLAKTFGVSKARVDIIAGETSKTKKVKISNIDSENFTKILGRVLCLPA